MLAQDDKTTLKILKDIRAFLGSVEINGYDAIDYADCMRFLNAWIAISEKSPENQIIKEKLKKRRERYKQKKADLAAIQEADKQTDNG